MGGKWGVMCVVGVWYVCGTWMICGWFVDGTWVVCGWYVCGTWLVYEWYIGGTWLSVLSDVMRMRGERWSHLVQMTIKSNPGQLATYPGVPCGSGWELPGTSRTGVAG